MRDTSLTRHVTNSRKTSYCSHSDPSSYTQTKHRHFPVNQNLQVTCNQLRGGGSLPEPNIVKAAIGATSQMMFSLGLGAIAAKIHVLDRAAVSILSRLAYWIFQPCFLLCSVASTISKRDEGGIDQLSLALITLSSLLQISIGSLFSKLAASMARLHGDGERRDARFCMTFANAGTFPFIFANALFKDNSAMLQGISACLSFFLLGWSPTFWVYGKALLVDDDRIKSEDETNPMFVIVAAMKKFLSPPIAGSVLGLVIGSIPFLRNALMKGGILSPLYGAVQTLGFAYLPSAILVLAGSLVDSPNRQSNAVSNNNENPSITTQTSPIRIRTLIFILLSRFILAPLGSLGILYMYDTFELLPSNAQARAMLSFVVLLQGCMPPSQNSVIILQMAGFARRASQMAKILTITYAISIVPITLLIGQCLEISKVLNV